MGIKNIIGELQVNGNPVVTEDKLSVWATIKRHCEQGIANQLYHAGMQITDHSEKYGDVVFDIVNVTPTEVIIQTHEIIGEPISIGYFGKQEDVYTSGWCVDEEIPAGSYVSCVFYYFYQGEQTWFDDYGIHVALTDIPAGTYGEEVWEMLEYNEDIQEENYSYTVYQYEEAFDIDEPPELLLVDYAASINNDMSEAFRSNVGIGFIPELIHVGGQEYNNEYEAAYVGMVWQYYRNTNSPHEGNDEPLRQKGGYWAVYDVDCPEWDEPGWSPQGLDRYNGCYVACAIGENGALEYTYSGGGYYGDCGIAPAFSIGTPYEENYTLPDEGNLCRFDLYGNIVDSNTNLNDIFTNGNIGLEYELYDDHAELVGIGECINTTIHIANYAAGRPVTIIGDSAFQFRLEPTSIIIPDFVTSINKSAFYYCENLTSVTIPASVISIGDRAFTYCRSLADVYYTGSQEQWNKISIGTSNTSLKNATIHYNYDSEV